MDNKQKIIEILQTYSHIYCEKNDYKDIAEEIDALYNRDCEKCKNWLFPINLTKCGSCKDQYKISNYEEK